MQYLINVLQYGSKCKKQKTIMYIMVIQLYKNVAIRIKLKNRKMKAVIDEIWDLWVDFYSR